MKMQEIKPIIRNLKKYFNEKIGDANITTDDYTNGFDKWMEKIAIVSHAAFITYLVFSLMGYKEACPLFDLDFKNN